MTIDFDPTEYGDVERRREKAAAEAQGGGDDVRAPDSADQWKRNAQKATMMVEQLFLQNTEFATRAVSSAYQVADLTAALRAAEEREKRAEAALLDCAKWMEQLRASGDAGFWEWSEGDEYTRAMALLNGQKGGDA